jgi:hypothetical protein
MTMLKLLLLTVFGLATSAARPQSILDLTEQLAIDGEKLASMKATLQDMYRGYTELQQGYTRIRDVVKGNFNLHEAFLDALWIMSPAIRGDPRLVEIIDIEYRIVAAYKAATGRVGAQPVWTAQELGYITGTYSTLLQRTMAAIEELTMISTDNTLRMSDAQRLTALARIDAEVKGELGFLERFDAELSIEAARRTQESNDINTLKSLYGLPN